MPGKRTERDKKQEFINKWSGLLDDKFIDYSLPIRTPQQFICLKNDLDHRISEYFDEDEKLVKFTSTLERTFSSVNCCPICIKQYSHQPPTNKISQEEIEQKIVNHLKNNHENKTILITPYTNMQANHTFRCGCGQTFVRAMTDAFRPDRWLLCLNCSKMMYKQEEIKERKELFYKKWNGIVDDALINYCKSTKDIQQFICLSQDINHRCSELYNEEKEYVIFESTIEQVLNNENNCCPICIDGWRHREAYNKLTHEEVCERIETHSNNKSNESGKKTILISKYTCMSNLHEFQCSCGNKFERRMTDILKNDRSFLCIECSYTGASRIALEWLDSLNIPHLITIRSGKEFVIPKTRYKVDGFDPITKTIYEFHGCEFHGHCTVNPNCPLTKNKGPFSYYGDTFIDLYDRTQSRKEEIQNLGYRCVEIWECEYRALKKM